MTANPQTLLSVSIVAYHSPPAELEATLTSLALAAAELNNRYPSDGDSNDEWESRAPVVSVVLIDNSESGSIDSEQFASLQNRLATANCGLTLIQGNGNIGYGAGHNLAIMSSKADFHLILNPDVLLAQDSLVHGLRYLQEQPEAVLISPFAESPNGEQQYLCKRYPAALILLLRGFLPALLGLLFPNRHAAYEMRDLPQNEPSSVPIASGCFMLCRRAALVEANGFDKRYFLYFEDFDLSLRLGKLGKLIYLPSMKIIHGGGGAARKGIKHIALFIRSGIRFFNQWGWRWL